MMDNLEKDATFYDRRWEIQSKNVEKYHNRYIRLYEVAAGFLCFEDIVLELGCGLGYFAGVNLVTKVKDFLCVDFSSEAIRIAKRMYPNSKDKFLVADAIKMEIKFPYNTIVALELLEHTESDQTILRRIQSGTKIIFSVPLTEKPRAPGIPIGYPVHRRIYTQDSLRERYKDCLNISKIVRIARGKGKWAVVLGSR